MEVIIGILIGLWIGFICIIIFWNHLNKFNK